MRMFAILLGILVVPLARAEDAVTWNMISKVSLEFKGLANGQSQGEGWLLGARFDRFLNEKPIYFDLGVDFGKGSGQDETDLSLIALGLGGEKVFDRFLAGGRADFDIISAEVNSVTQGYAGMELEAYAGVVLGGGWRLDLTGGYLRTFQLSSYSGGTFGIRFDYKAERTITEKPLND